ncbi:MAG: hypothetical protein J6U82_01580 [Alistipes sp.]|nr:hypothetical protein [Alistipes sp.]
MKNLKIWSLALTLLIAMVGCEKGGDDKVDGGNTTPKVPFKPVDVTELAEKIVGKWELKQYADQPADFDVYIDFRADLSYELFERAYGYTFEFREGTYTLEGDYLTGVYTTGDKWNNSYTIMIAENPTRLRLYEDSGVYAEYEAVEEFPAYVVGNAPVWDGEYRPVPAIAASGYVEITHPGQFASLLAVTETVDTDGNKVENISAKGLKVKLMNDLYFNDIALEPVVNFEHFRDFQLDGNGFCLYGLNLKNEGAVAALFPEVVDAKFSNLTINGITVDAGQGENAYAAALLGVTYGDVVVENVVVKNATIKGTNKVGGLIGSVMQNSIVVKKSGVVESTIETYDVAEESGLAGGLIGYISCVEEAKLAAASTIEECYVKNTTLNVINSRKDNNRANSEFIGGIGGDDGDIIYLDKNKVENVTLSDKDTTPLYEGLIGGTRGRFTVCFEGVADYNGYVADALPEAVAGVVEIVTPSQFAKLLTDGAPAETKAVIKNNFNFNGATLTPVNNFDKFRELELDGDEKVISGINVSTEGTVAALFPQVADAMFSNLVFEKITVDAGEGEEAYAGTLIGLTYGDVVLDNVKISESTVKGTNKVGGLIGSVMEDSITATGCVVTKSTIETYDVADESGLAGGLIGYISCQESADTSSTIESCEVTETTITVINSRDSEARANSEFIGGIGGEKNDNLFINKAKVEKNTFTETGATTYKKLHDLVGGTRGEFNMNIDGVAYWNGLTYELPKANAKGVIELTKAGEFVTLVQEGVPANTKVTLKYNFDFMGGALAPVVDFAKFTEFQLDGANKTISNFTITTEGTVAALFPEVVGGKFSNLTISKATVDAGEGEAAYAGALLGITYGDVVLNNVKVSESTVKGTNKVGGVIGSVMENSITATKCVVTKSTIETYNVTDESGLAGGLIGYIACQGDEDVDAVSKVESCEVTESTFTVINSRDSEARANSEFIGGVGGDKGDELIINKAKVDNNTFNETGATTYKKLHDLVGGIRGEFKITVDSEVIFAPEEDETQEGTEGTEGSENTEGTEE